MKKDKRKGEKKMKLGKRLATGVLLFSVPILLTACSGNERPETNENGDTIIRIGRQTAPNPKLPEGDSYSDNAYTRLIQEELGIELESVFEAHGDDYNRQVSLAIASGDLPDVMLVGSRDELQEMVDNDLVEDMTDVFEETASANLKDIYKSFDDIQLEAATFDGRLMAIPSTSYDFGPNMVWMRQDWLDKLGIELDKDGNNAITLDELKDTAKAFKEQDPGNTGKTQGLALAYWLSSGNHGGSAYTGTPIMNAFGAFPKSYIKDEQGKMIYGSNTQGMKESLQFIKELYDEGILDPQFGTRTYEEINAMMINGELGVIPGPWHMPDWGLIQAKQTNPEAIFAPFAIENASGDGKINALSSPGTGQYIVVRKGFKHPEKIIEMINLIDDKVANSTNMEEEFPEIYEYSKLDVDGTVKPFNVIFIKANSEIEDAMLASKAALGEIPMEELSNFSLRDNAEKIKAYMDDPNVDPVVWTRYASRYLAENNVMGLAREKDLLTEITPPRFNKIEANERNGAQLGKLEEETFIKYITGEESLDNFDQYIEKWHSQGGTEVLAEMQAIVDEQAN
jgi:putative aldouronate transport system substrate-binding protein